MNSTNYFKRLLAIIFLLAVSLGGCSESGRPLLQVGEKAPAFNLQLLSGEQINLERYAGKGVVITFMSSWCPCSNDSMPLMKKAYQEHKADLAFLMIGTQDARSKFEKFTRKWEVPFSTGYDEDDLIARAYGVSSPPTTFFIDRTGIVKRAFYGNISEKPKEFPRWLEELM
jgi:peroxiredoxin